MAWETVRRLTLRPLSVPETKLRMRSRLAALGAIVVLLAALWPASAAADSHVTLLQAHGRGEVWHVAPDGHRHWVPTLGIFQARGLQWSDVRQVSQAQLGAYPVGRAYVTSGTPDGLAHCRAMWRGGCLYRTPSDGRVYLYDGGVRWVQTLETFNGLGLWWDAVIDVDHLPAGVTHGPPLNLGLAPAPGPTPGPAPVPGPTLPNHPDAALVRDTAIARGADADLAGRIAIDVIGRGTWDAFLRGVDAGVSHGTYHCQWRSPQCPLAPERPPEPIKSPREQAAALVDPALMPALDLLKAVRDAAGSNGETTTFALIVYLNMPVTFGALPAGSNGRISVARGGQLAARIVVNDAYRGESTRSVATTLAHEMWHALAYATGRLGTSWAACIEAETEADTAAAWFWSKVRPGPGARLTPLEQQAEWNYLHWIDGTLEDEVLDRYWDTCAA